MKNNLARLEKLDAVSEEEVIEKQAKMIAENEIEQTKENEAAESKEEHSQRNIFTFALFGYEGAIVSVETDLRRGIPTYDIVGISDGMVKVTREVIKATFRNSGLEVPSERILQSLSPADRRKVKQPEKRDCEVLSVNSVDCGRRDIHQRHNDGHDIYVQRADF